MKANELMIGDLVSKCSNSGIVSNVKVDIEELNDVADPKARGFYTWSGIPLTKEILKANGFVKQSFNCVYFFWAIPEFMINSNMFLSIGSNNFKIQYVHELQHALRLCGLTKLADNFKLE